MQKIEIKPNIFWVGGIDWDIRNFHGYTTQRGTTYNAYLIMDEPEKGRVASVGKSLFENVLSRIGFAPNPKEKHTTSIMRDQIIFQAALFGSEKAEAFAPASVRPGFNTRIGISALALFAMEKKRRGFCMPSRCIATISLPGSFQAHSR